jgi:AAA family ATP:ADP antiporter
MASAPLARERPSALDRALRVFSDVHAGEGVTVLLMFVTLLSLLLGYYVIKTVRDTLILTMGGAEVKAYSAAGQAVVLMGFVPLYSWFATRVSRVKLIVGVMVFFLVTLELFVLALAARMPYVSVAFYIWVGIFNIATVAQFWSFANDLYRRADGERLFPAIAIGATAGSPLGAWLAQQLFEAGVRPVAMLQLSAAALLVHLALYAVVQRRESHRPAQAAAAQERIPRGEGFSLVLQNPYLRLVALLMIVLNVVNTTGNFILDTAIAGAAQQAMQDDPTVSEQSFVGAAYGQFYFWQNVLAVLVQAFLVSRIVKYLGLRGVLLASPLVAFGAYGLVAAGAGFAAIRWAKTAENAADYSVMNTGRQMLWLPTRREEKYKAKQAVDTFFVRTGDVLAAGLIFVGGAWLGLGSAGFAVANLVLIAVWLALVALIVRHHRTLAGEKLVAVAEGARA